MCETYQKKSDVFFLYLLYFSYLSYFFFTAWVSRSQWVKVKGHNGHQGAQCP